MNTSTNSPVSASLDFCFSLVRAQALLSRRFDGPLGGHGLSLGDLMVLNELGRAEGGRLRRVDLAEKIGVTASAVTRTLIPLERIGLVNRERDPNDARVGFASLTRAGVRVLGEALDTAERIAERAVSENTAAEVRALTKTLTRLPG